MIINIFIVFFSLSGLIFLHEFGHFILAKKFKVRVDEFGLGYPPRLLAKKVGETVYSLNLLPFGGFVRLYGEEEHREDRGSFFGKPIYQRVLIIAAGIFSFWLVSFVLFSLVLGLGAPTVIEDEADGNLIKPQVQIVAIAPDSPAQKAELKVGDTIVGLKAQGSRLKVSKVKEVQAFTEQYKGEETILTIERGKEVFDVSLIPRLSPPEGEGPMGLALVRTAVKSWPWYLAGFEGLKITFNLSFLLVKGWVAALKNLILGKAQTVQLMGPVGIFGMFLQVSQLGLTYFLNFIGVIALHLALLNFLPIPALDGGKLLFLGIEKVRGKPVKEKTEQQITSVFFALLILLMIWVTIKDVIRLF